MGQLAPNTVLQINGLIARCEVLGEYPSPKLLFSIYRAKTTGVQVYFDKRPRCSRLVEAPSSNSGWHPMFAWYSGGELDEVKPWKRLCNSQMANLSQTGVYAPSSLVRYFKAGPYHPSQFRETEFLNSHGRKASFLF